MRGWAAAEYQVKKLPTARKWKGLQRWRRGGGGGWTEGVRRVGAGGGEGRMTAWQGRREGGDLARLTNSRGGKEGGRGWQDGGLPC